MTEDSATTEQKLVKQLEYYFGNINLPRDKFLQEKLKQDEGWVPIDVLLTFNRLAQISSDAELIAKAVKEAESDIISVSEDGKKIRRNIGNPLPENSLEYWQKIKHCTVYMKGFPQDAKLDDIMNFAKKYGQVENVLMRRTKGDRTFKGSVFCTFKTREQAESAQKSEDKFGDIQLIKMMQDDYWLAKNKETKERRQNEKMAKQGKSRADAEQAKQVQPHFVKGLVLSVEGLGEEANVNSIKEFFKKYGNASYVVHEKGDTKAEIRFAGEEDGAKQAWEKAVAEGQDGKVIFQDKEITAKVLEGEEETKYWDDFNAKVQSKNSRSSGGQRGRGRKRPAGDRGNNKWKGKRTVFEDESGEPVAEVKADEKTDNDAAVTESA